MEVFESFPTTDTAILCALTNLEAEQRPLALFVSSSLYSPSCREGVFSETRCR
jgi:hypothetical protein